ncbi:MAG TPA: carbohydrate ABC transporter permease [Rhodoblastus sp.]|nr:carbohydrate ABC transporter permease [Rhodoblastus sp.]
MSARREIGLQVGLGLAAICALLWAIPFLWVLVAAFRPDRAGGEMASLLPNFVPTAANFLEAWDQADFLRYGLNSTLICGGILVVQLVTMSLAGFAFARLEFPGREIVFNLVLVQMMIAPVILIVPNLKTVAALGLYDTLGGVMAPYLATAFGTFLMRQTFRTVPREFEEAALIDGASKLDLIRFVYLPLAKPAVVAFAIVSVTAHWNEFLWPLMVINSPSRRPLTVGLAMFTQGAEGAQAWGIVAAGTLIVIAPLVIVFLIFQRRFVESFMASGLK